MQSLADWVEYVNNDVNNMRAEIVEFLPGHHKIAVKLYGWEAVDVVPVYNTNTEDTLMDLIDRDIDTLDLELTDDYTSAIFTGVNPYGLTAYIKAAY